MWGELASHKRSLTHAPSQFSKLGIQVSLAIICLFVWAMVGWVALPFFSFLFFFKLVCYAHVFPCIGNHYLCPYMSIPLNNNVYMNYYYYVDLSMFMYTAYVYNACKPWMPIIMCNNYCL